MFRLSKVVRVVCLFVLLSLVVSALPLNPVSGQASGVQSPYRGIWISASELAALPTSGTAWNALLNAANSSAGSPDIQNQDSDNDVKVLAKALVYARTGDTKYRSEVISQLKSAVGTEAGGRTLALGRNLVSYVIAADLINLPAADSSFDSTFRSWLRKTLTETLDGRTLVSTHEERPNNWGTHAGASRAAVAIYLGDNAELARTATVFKGLLGDRSAYAGFDYGDLSWQCDASKPVGINPKGCTRNGYSIDGALPEEMRRGGTFKMPPVETGYAWEALQGITVQAMILHRAGYPAFEWSDRAILRAVQYLYNVINWPAESDDTWQPWLINYAYGTSFPTKSPAGIGKNMGWTDWTHARKGSTTPPTNPTAAPTKQPPAPTATPTQRPQTLPTATKVAPTQAPQQPTATKVFLPTATKSAPTATLVVPTATQPAPVQPTATQPAPAQPTATQAAPAQPTSAPSGNGLVKAITFEGGNLKSDSDGVDRTSGSVSLSSDSEVSGRYSVKISGAKDAWLQEDFSALDNIYVAFTLKVVSLPSENARVMLISNDGDTIGNIVLNKDGSLKLRYKSDTVGSNSAKLALNTLYRVVLHQTSSGSLEAFVAPVGQPLGAPFASMTGGSWNNKATFIRFGATMSASLNARFDDVVINSQQMP